jgi:hypothetical protein
LTPDYIIYRSEFHPHPPIQVIEFLKYELQVGKKYVVLLNGESAEQFGRLWNKHVHLLCIVEEDEDYLTFIRAQLGESPDLWTAQSSLSSIQLDDDSLDAALLLGSSFLKILPDEDKIKELERTLRLNSFVTGIFHRLQASEERTFAWAFAQFFKQYSNEVEHEYLRGPSEEELLKFYKSGYEIRSFANQVRLDWDGLQGYFLSSRNIPGEDDPKFKWALKALRILFDQYALEGVVILDYQTELYFGLFNKNVPAISLRKNIFFTLLRPFAFAFYVLVKLNIYFWKTLERLFIRKKHN